MVVQVINDTPLEAPVIHKLDMESHLTKVEDNGIKTNKRRKLKRSSSQSNNEHALISNLDTISTEINHHDLEELQSVYKKCKAVMKKIETKYGHLLKTKDNLVEEGNYLNTCTCKFNKKMVFDDEGRYITKEIIPEIHICPKKQRFSTASNVANKPNVQIEDEYTLPTDLKELCEILKDESIDVVYRNKVIEKIKAIRLDNANTMRFDRKNLIKRLKLEGDELMEFYGANVFSLSGYSTNPSKES